MFVVVHLGSDKVCSLGASGHACIGLDRSEMNVNEW